MSEPVTNAEIEDVLSAVRRLVSQSGPDRREERRPETMGKLILTPAFRVDAAPVAPADADAPMAENVEPDTPRHSATIETLVQRAVGTTPEVEAYDDVDEDWDEEPEPHHTAEAEPVDAGDYDLPEAFAADVDADEETVATLESRIAELESVVTPAETEEWEPEGTEDEEQATTVIFRHAGAASGAPARGPQPAAVTETDEVREDAVADMPEPDPVGVGEAVEIDVQEWEDVEAAEDSAYETPELDDDAYDDAAYAQTPDQVYDDYEIGENTADDMVIDEDMLREIVGRLVREELQGTMGERITRNLRRMVRREIARAMALKDFD